jgi:SSS family solute:Na+ symporter
VTVEVWTAGAQALTIMSFVFFTAVVGVLTWLLTRGDRHDTREGYFLAGRTLTAGYIAGSLLLTNLSTEQLIGLNGSAFVDGLSVIAWEVIAAVALVAMALFFLPRYLRGGIATVPELLEHRFGSTTRSLTAVLFIAAYAAILLPIILYTGATGMIGILDLSAITGIESEQTLLWLVIWAIGIVGAIYAVVGGLRTVAVSDTVNGFGLFIGGGLITWLGLQAVSDGGLFAALAELRTSHPEHFNSIGRADQQVPFSTLFTGVLLLNLFYWTTNQQIIQRTFGARSLAEGQKGLLLAAAIKILSPIILVLPGLIAFHLYASNGIRPDHAYGTLVRDVLPVWATGFFAAAVFGAILSSFNSALNSTATLFSLSVYQPMIRPQATDAEVVRSGHHAGWIVAAASMLTAPLLSGQDSIFAYLQDMNGLYFIPLFAVVVIGLTTRRVPAVAANIGLVTGVVVLLLGYFVPPFSTMAAGIHRFHFLGLVFAALMALMLVIGILKPRTTEWIQADTRAVDMTPWRFVLPTSLSILIVVVTIYVAFAGIPAV